MEKYAKYIPYVILAIFGFMLWHIIKIQNAHTEMFLDFIGKARRIPEKDKALGRGEKANGKGKSHDEAEHQEPVNNDEEIVRISERLYNKKALTKKDKEFYAEFKKEIDDEVIFFLGDDMQRISDDIKAGNEITSSDKELYEENFETFKAPLKLEELTADVQVREDEKKSEAVTPQTEEERKHLVLTFFDDGMPRVIGALANLYADATGLVPSTGNTAKVLDALLAEGKLKNQKIACGDPKRNKVFYGKPEWFEGKKFQKDYIKKIK